MKKLLLSSSAILFISAFSFCQSTRLKFDQGQQLEVTLDTKTTISQQAMGQSIDFNVNATGVQTYKVTNATDDNTTLHHEVKKVTFSFDGMGQKKSFDSDNEKDLNGMFGKPVKEMKEKPYDVIIDPVGTVMMAFPETVKLSEGDSRLAIINNMLRGVMDMVQPPKKGTASFFKILPDKEVVKGDTWTENINDESGKFNNTYTVSDITDSTIIVDFTGTSTIVTKAEMMGNPTTTTMNHKSSGKIIVDKNTRLMKEKTVTMDGTGNTETSFGSLPVTSKNTMTITVKPAIADASK